MDVIANINKLYKQKFTRDSLFYRWQHPHHFIDEKDGKFFVTGNPHSNAAVDDIYKKPVRHNFRATSLDDPVGLGVLDCPAADFRVEGPLNLEIRLGDALDIGGKLYLYLMCGPNSWYITIPKGQRLPAMIFKGDMDLAKLGVAYNRVLNSVDAVINVVDWLEDDSNFFKVLFYQRKNEECKRPPYQTDFTIEQDGMISIQKYRPAGRLDEAQIIGASVLNILMKHPELKGANLPMDAKALLEPVLDKLNVSRYQLSTSPSILESYS
jgi:hypothetical protein